MPTQPNGPNSVSAPDGRPRGRVDDVRDIALTLFAERGYHGASTQAIADVLGMRQASLYYYFASKEAALELVCEHPQQAGAEGRRPEALGPLGDRLRPVVRRSAARIASITSSWCAHRNSPP